MNRVKLYSFLFISFVYQFTFSQNANFKWAERIGGGSLENCKAMTTDAKGNIYLTGFFYGVVDFDPGPGVFNLDNTNYIQAAFIAKLDSNGSLIWAKKIGGRGNQNNTVGVAIVVDAASNVYTTGYYTDTVDFDPGIDSFKMVSRNYDPDAFVSKLDSLGNFIWAKQLGGMWWDEGTSIGIDSSCNIYVGGYFSFSGDFDPNSGTYTLISKGQYDAFICKLDSSGSFIWARQIGGKRTDFLNSMDIDKSGDIYLTGSFQDTCDIDPGTGVHNLVSFGNEDVFITKLNANGNFVWGKQIAGYGVDNGNVVKLDNLGKVYIAGTFTKTAYLYPGPPGYNVTSAGKKDIFISNFDTSGKINWLVKLGGDSDDVCNALAVDKRGDLYLTGKFQDTANFNPGSGINSLISSGYDDVFISKIDSSGKYVWANRIGSTSPDEGTAINIDNSNNITTVGNFSQTVDFDPGPGVFNLTSFYKYNYTTDFFIQRMKECSNTYYSINASGCDSVIVNNQTYKSSGSYIQAIQNASGCYNIITVNATVTKSTSNNLSYTACDFISFNGIGYSSTGIYRQRLTNAVGCDSILTLNITINKSASKSLIIGACRKYEWNGQTYTSSGSYSQILKTSTGCDSIVTLLLTVIPKSNTSVYINGITLGSYATGVTYQWIDCSTYDPIPGETSQTMTPYDNGSYAVILTRSVICKDTSECYTVKGIGLNSGMRSNSIRVFPNPASNKITINSENETRHANLKLVSISGQLVIEKRGIVLDNYDLDLSGVGDGMYVLEINEDGNIYHTRFIKMKNE